jgi:hypothetical protein
VTSNAFNPVAVSKCLSKIIGPVFHALSTIAVKVKEDFQRYETENGNFQAQLRQCDVQLRDTVAGAETLVQQIRQCVKKWEENDSA